MDQLQEWTVCGNLHESMGSPGWLRDQVRPHTRISLILLHRPVAPHSSSLHTQPHELSIARLPCALVHGPHQDSAEGVVARAAMRRGCFYDFLL